MPESDTSVDRVTPDSIPATRSGRRTKKATPQVDVPSKFCFPRLKNLGD